jgi:hypothetical protein
VLAAAREMLAGCGCDEGCPVCTGFVASTQGGGGRATAIALADALLAVEPISPTPTPVGRAVLEGRG